MTPPTPDSTRAFRTLERALLRRRIAALDILLRLELLAIATLVTGFVFWQTRAPLANAAFHAGAPGATRVLAWRLAVLIVAGGALAGGAHLHLLRSGLPGPPWLCLPLTPAALAAHARRLAIPHAVWMLPLMAGVALAGIGIVPALWLALMALAALIALLVTARLACALTGALASSFVTRRPRVPALVALLARGAASHRARQAPRARWVRGPVWQALLRKDARLALRPGAARQRLAAAALCALLSAAAWALPGSPELAPLAAFMLALFAAGLFARWLIAVVNSDPPIALRPLPVGLGAAWGARIAWVSIGALTLVTTQAAAATRLEPAPHQLLLFGVGLAAFTIGVLAVNYAISLYPDANDADRMFALSAGLALAGSLMIPLMGWIVLLTAVLHSLRRVTRWRRPESP